MLIIIWVIIGAAIGWGIASFMEGRGGLNPLWSSVAGVVGAVVVGFLFIQFGTALVSEGPLPIVSFLAAANRSRCVCSDRSNNKKMIRRSGPTVLGLDQNDVS